MNRSVNVSYMDCRMCGGQVVSGDLSSHAWCRAERIDLGGVPAVEPQIPSAPLAEPETDEIEDDCMPLFWDLPMAQRILAMSPHDRALSKWPVHELPEPPTPTREPPKPPPPPPTTIHVVRLKPTHTKNKQEMVNIKTIKNNSEARKGTDLEKKPDFAFDNHAVRVYKPPFFSKRCMQRYYRPVHLFNREAVTNGRVDTDLVYNLKLYSAFQPRTISLANSLKMRAIRWMNDFNMSDVISSQEMYEIVINSVVEAMQIDVNEKRIKKRDEQDNQFKSWNEYFRSGPLAVA